MTSLVETTLALSITHLLRYPFLFKDALADQFHVISGFFVAKVGVSPAGPLQSGAQLAFPFVGNRHIVSGPAPIFFISRIHQRGPNLTGLIPFTGFGIAGGTFHIGLVGAFAIGVPLAGDGYPNRSDTHAVEFTGSEAHILGNGLGVRQVALGCLFGISPGIAAGVFGPGKLVDDTALPVVAKPPSDPHLCSHVRDVVTFDEFLAFLILLFILALVGADKVVTVI